MVEDMVAMVDVAMAAAVEAVGAGVSA
jgi:hypothetical protein